MTYHYFASRKEMPIKAKAKRQAAFKTDFKELFRQKKMSNYVFSNVRKKYPNFVTT